MTRKGQLTVTGTQRDEAGEESSTCVSAEAEYYIRDGSHYILYAEDSPEGTVKSLIKLRDGILELTRKGAVGARMVFEPGREYITLYSTPYGSIPLGILTDTLESDFQENMLRLRADYTLTSEGMPVSKCKLLIKMLFNP